MKEQIALLTEIAEYAYAITKQGAKQIEYFVYPRSNSVIFFVMDLPKSSGLQEEVEGLSTTSFSLCNPRDVESMRAYLAGHIKAEGVA